MSKSMKWAERMLQVADLYSSWSKDPDHQVGAVITTTDNRIVSAGYNGFPRGIEKVETRLKLFSVVHAEVNAIVNARCPIRGMTMTVTRRPCAQCSAMIIQAGISVVVTRPHEPGSKWYRSCKIGSEMMQDHGIYIIVIC
jgi:dCMP deaminase